MLHSPTGGIRQSGSLAPRTRLQVARAGRESGAFQAVLRPAVCDSCRRVERRSGGVRRARQGSGQAAWQRFVRVGGRHAFRASGGFGSGPMTARACLRIADKLGLQLYANGLSAEGTPPSPGSAVSSDRARTAGWEFEQCSKTNLSKFLWATLATALGKLDVFARRRGQVVQRSRRLECRSL
jgi:hypothetical protein